MRQKSATHERGVEYEGRLEFGSAMLLLVFEKGMFLLYQGVYQDRLQFNAGGFRGVRSFEVGDFRFPQLVSPPCDFTNCSVDSISLETNFTFIDFVN